MKKLILPKLCEFKTTKYKNVIKKAKRIRRTREFEKLCYPIAQDILLNYERFTKIERGPEFTGTPFDVFGFKDGAPYIIELKSSLKQFNLPGVVQRIRMQQVQKSIRGLKIALLQIKLNTGEYRILYDKDLKHFLNKERRQAPIEPITDWIRKRL